MLSDSKSLPVPRPPPTDPSDKADVGSTRASTSRDLLAPVVEIANLRCGAASAEGGRGRRRGAWSKSAWEAMEKEGACVKLALDRQVGGVAQDERFRAEIGWVKARLLQDISGRWYGGDGLHALGFMVTKIVALHRRDLEEAFVGAVVRVGRERRRRRGWGVYLVPQSDRNGGRAYVWNERTGESRWELDEGEGDSGDGGDGGDGDGDGVRVGGDGEGEVEEDGGGAACWGAARVVGGSNVVMTWAPLRGEAARQVVERAGGWSRRNQVDDFVWVTMPALCCFSHPPVVLGLRLSFSYCPFFDAVMHPSAASCPPLCLTPLPSAPATQNAEPA
jgi:hypothetical protein